MKILDFNNSHVEEARLIAMDNYNEERENVAVLPKIDKLPDIEHFASNELGVAAFDKDKMIGFLCCYDPWENAFNSTSKGTFSPIHAHGTILENRSMIYKRLYQAAAEKWIKHKITYHAIGLYAHDKHAINALFTYGFGLRCVDAIRPMDSFMCQICKDITFEELAKKDMMQVRKMRHMLSEHMGKSPCFMYSSLEEFERWLVCREKRNNRLFVARDKEKLVAFIEISNNGENFITQDNTICNICGAFCLPEHRGKNIYQNLVNYTIVKLKSEGYKILGVDFESFNPTANNFWLKYFTAYTNSLVRRIDECALHD